MAKKTVLVPGPGRPRRDGTPNLITKEIEVPDAEEQTEEEEKTLVEEPPTTPPEVKEPEPDPFPEDATIEVGGPVRPPSLVDAQFDPFERFKTDKDKFYYRALNTRPHLLRKRKAQGYETFSDEARHGDLVLGRLPRETKEARDRLKKEKKKGQTQATVEQFVEESERHGIKPIRGS